MKRLDKNINIRRENYSYWWTQLSDRQYYIPEYQGGNSSFSFPLIAKEVSVTQRLKMTFKSEGIEYRPIISGNLLRHPAFNKYKLCTEKENPNVELLNTNGLYVGNSQFVTKKKIDRLISILGV